jgi:hypothetical protein
MFHRIGQKKQIYFAVLDLTSRFFQAPLSEQSSKYCAFISRMTLFEWRRVPMGLKDTPLWFQHLLASELLGSLLHRTCELYIDELIVYVENLRGVHATTRISLLTPKGKRYYYQPRKEIKFITTEVEYLGY